MVLTGGLRHVRNLVSSLGMEACIMTSKGPDKSAEGEPLNADTTRNASTGIVSKDDMAHYRPGLTVTVRVLSQGWRHPRSDRDSASRLLCSNSHPTLAGF